MIGNSLSEDASAYLHEMAAADGRTINLTVKGVGGAQLKHHADNLKNELTIPDYEPQGGQARQQYFTYYNDVMAEDAPLTLTSALYEKQYDVITFQEFNSGHYTEEYFEENVDYLGYLVSEIKKLQPNAHLMMYEIWSFNSSTLSARNSRYKTEIGPITGKMAKTFNLLLIPSGKAFNTAQVKYEEFNEAAATSNSGTPPEALTGSYLWPLLNGSTGLYRDDNHASFYGRYLTDAVIYETITGARVNEAFTVPAPNGISPAEHARRLNILRDIAHKVVCETD